MSEYVGLVRDFSAAVLLFHGTIAQRFGLHGTDLKALRLLAVEAMTAGRLAEATGLTNAAVTALVDRLEASGYVVRERDAEDRRRVTIRLVPSALRELDRLYAGQASQMTRFLETFDDAAFTAILSYLGGATEILTHQVGRIAQGK